MDTKKEQIESEKYRNFEYSTFKMRDKFHFRVYHQFGAYYQSGSYRMRNEAIAGARKYVDSIHHIK